MTQSGKNPKVDAFFSEATQWKEELKKLRRIILDCHLTEEFKWGKPCYAWEGSNVVVLLPLKEYCTILFCKGALLKDAGDILYRPSENTQATRHFRLTGMRDIAEKETLLKSYIREAIEAEKAGLEVTYKKISEFTIPEELQIKLDEVPALKKAFEGLTPGRRRGYMLYISGAKQAKTRVARVEKCMPRILEGKGMDD